MHVVFNLLVLLYVVSFSKKILSLNFPKLILNNLYFSFLRNILNILFRGLA